MTSSKYNHEDFPGGPVVKNLPCNVGDSGSIPGQGTKIPHTLEQLSQCANYLFQEPQLESQCTAMKDLAWHKTQHSQINKYKLKKINIITSQGPMYKYSHMG